MSEFPLTESRFGFAWGPLLVERLASDPKFGVVIRVSTDDPERYVDIRVSPKGRTIDITRSDPRTRGAV